MRVYMLKDVEKIGLAGEIIKVNDGFAKNFLVPNGLAKQVTKNTEAELTNKARVVQNRKETIASKTSMLAEKIQSATITIKRKVHEDQLYGSLSQAEIVDALKAEGITVKKSQVVFDKRITSKGKHTLTIRLSST